MNHTIDECYSKHGYPPWFKQRQDFGNQDKDNSSQPTCNLNVKEDLTWNNTKTNKQDSTGFTPEQIQKLLQFIEHAKKPGHSVNRVQRKDSNTSNYITQQGSISWILDTNATDHVTYTKEHFITFHKIKPICIKLPNSSTLTVHFARTIHFLENFIIFNVLYIPEFTFNLIFVRTLIKDLKIVY